MSDAAVAGRRLMVATLACLPVMIAGCALFKRDLEPPTVTLRGVTPENLQRDGQVFRCRLLLENPNTEDLRVVGGKVTLELAGVNAGQGETISGFTLPALGSREVDLRVTLDLVSSLTGALRFLNSGQTDVDYMLRGYVDLDVKALGRLPFTSSGKVTVDDVLRQVPGLIRPAPGASVGPAL